MARISFPPKVLLRSVLYCILLVVYFDHDRISFTFWTSRVAGYLSLPHGRRLVVRCGGGRAELVDLVENSPCDCVLLHMQH